jgi:hypothetical protein
MVISPFSLDWFNQNSGDWTALLPLLLDVLLNVGQTLVVLGVVLTNVFVQGIFVARKVGFWP